MRARYRTPRKIPVRAPREDPVVIRLSLRRQPVIGIEGPAVDLNRWSRSRAQPAELEGLRQGKGTSVREGEEET